MWFSLPEPKLDSDDVDLVSVLDTSADKPKEDEQEQEQKHKDKSLEGLFFLGKHHNYQYSLEIIGTIFLVRLFILCFVQI